jgi:hypothetical protein
MTTERIGWFDDLTVRCLFAVLAGANSVRDVQQACGIPSTATTYRRLQRLRDAGLITWDPILARTLRATVTAT